MRLYVFGGSTTQGFFDSEGGWVQRLASVLHKKTLVAIKAGRGERHTVFNLGVAGDTTADVVARLEAEVTARRKATDEDEYIVLAMGLNDTALEKNRAVQDVYAFQEQYEEAIQIAKDMQVKVICVGLTAVDESKTDPWIGSAEGMQWKNNRINLFEDAIRQSAIRHDVAFIGLHDTFLAKLDDGEALLADGLHPNDAGHAWLYAEVYKALADSL
jgi:lysophospholipase L1-like esterase